MNQLFAIIRLAWAYLTSHRKQSVAILIAISLAVSLPIVASNIVRQYLQTLATRSGNPPVMLSPRGSRFDAVLKVQYFLGESLPSLQWQDVTHITTNKSLRCIPVHLLHTANAQATPVIGTVRDYFAFRDLNLHSGHMFAQAGECVVGALVDVSDDVLQTDISNPFDLSAAPPLILTVVGRLQPSGTPDDQGVFVSLDTAWILDGYGHGHDIADQGTAAANSSVLSAATDGHRPNKSIRTIDEANRHKIHFHGNPNLYPISAVLIWPETNRDQVVLEGNYINHKFLQVLRPDVEIDTIMRYVFQMNTILQRIFLLLGSVTLLLIAVIIFQSLNARKHDLETMKLLGCSRLQVFKLLGTELFLLLIGSALLTVVVTAALIATLPSLESLI
jgi:putative ABC transport system permease protein